ncbi:MAG: hypothetical protein Q7T90_07130 [Thiobacillus sp.]|nr:hypothetical protein [Thiobacillus sp.]
MPLFMLPPLLFVTAVQATPYDPPAHGEGSVVFTPAARPHFSNLDPQPGGSVDARSEPRSNNRYGIGYDARHGIDTDGQAQRSNRMNPVEHLQQPARTERSGSAGRAGRGR